jgi:prepilin-type N-terminal cleavage/methylation domain-containing protein
MTRNTDTGTPELGFTIIELMVVVAIAAILIVAAAPSFSEFMSRRRVEGVTSELVTDLHYTRSEAVSRNERVGMFFGTDCYVIYRVQVPTASPTVATCTRTTKSIVPAAAELKTVQLDTGRPVSMGPGGATSVAFDPVRGMVTNSANTDTASVDVRSTSGTPWRLRATLKIMGRAETCRPADAPGFAGWAECS